MGSLKILSEMPEDKAEARSFFLEKEKWKTWPLQFSIHSLEWVKSLHLCMAQP